MMARKHEIRWRIWVAAAALSVFAVPGLAAQPTMYECDFAQHKSQRGWISPKMAIIIRAPRQVQVIDSVLIGHDQSPKTARVMRNDASLLVVRWNLDNARTIEAGNAGTYEYDLRLNKNTGRISVGSMPTSVAVGATRVSGRGTCRIRSNGG